VVTERELQALTEAIDASLGAKSGSAAYALSSRFLDNVLEGCKRPRAATGLAAQQQQQQQQPPGSHRDSQNGHDQDKPPAAAGAAAAAGGDSAGAAEQRAALRAAYQGLCACLQLRYFRRLLTLPEEEAWALLARLEAPREDGDDDDDDEGAGQEPGLLQQQLEQQPPAAPSSAAYAQVEAAEQDDDDVAYEDMAGPAASAVAAASPAAAVAAGSAAAAAAAAAAAGAYSWPALCAKLLAISSGVSYTLLEGAPAWREPGTFATLLELLRALGAHRRAHELAPALHAFINLLTDRVAASPADAQQLGALWDALGVPAVASAPRALARAGGGAAAAGELCLPAEARLAFSVVASLAGQLQGHGARVALWHQVSGHLLPPLVRCAEELAALAAPGGDALADALLLARVAGFLVAAGPANASGARLLQQAGGVRALVQLFCRHGAAPAAEPVRRALLLACAASAEVAAWVGAVPTLPQALAGEAFQEGGCAELHGALWPLVLQPGSDGALLGSILAGGLGPDKLDRLLRCLQLLAECHGAARRQQLWGPGTEQQLQRLHSELRQGAELAAGGARAAGEGAEAGGQSGAPEGDGEGEQKVHGSSSSERAQRKARQLGPQCTKLLKELLRGGGKTE
jgi:hypothetical protein